MSKTLNDNSAPSARPQWSPATHEARQPIPVPKDKDYHAEHKHTVRLVDSWHAGERLPDTTTSSTPPLNTALSPPLGLDKRFSVPLPSWESLLSTVELRQRSVPIGQQKFGSSPFEMDSKPRPKKAATNHVFICSKKRDSSREVQAPERKPHFRTCRVD
eukprot:Gregarina_sp_Pseudo_9__2208@NODE_254_length_3408_cov_12_512912_g237_i0_p4_GENE_NODE_254_length_3408_cov_12_512912_g237_i0NODE_254_length_3408_cov_12_512912_g237_i0_p4_ORF_typecomplete_len159_score5_32_NODE_254_length_3408_cov_12_512912_g237_i016382114